MRFWITREAGPASLQALAWVALLALASCGRSFEVDAADLDAQLAVVVPAVEAELGLRLERPVRARVATRTELRRVILEDLGALYAGEGSDAPADVRAATEALTGALIAKYSWSAREILVVPQNFNELAGQLGIPALASHEVLGAVLVHEVVHVADHERYDFPTVFATLGDPDAQQAYFALLEGHAQHVGRRVCARLGRAAAFETFTTAIGALPKGVDEGEAYIARLRASALVAAYHEGEHFVAALERAGGAAAIARAFREPPEDMAVVANPVWYLDPALRPSGDVDLEALLDALADATATTRDEGRWERRRTKLARPTLVAVASVLEPEQAEELAALLELNAALLLTAKVREGAGASGVAAPDQLVAVAVSQQATPAAAERYLELAAEISRVKDEQMQTGAVRIASSSTEAIKAGAFRGWVARKEVMVGSTRHLVVTLAGHVADLSLEVTLSGVDVERDELLALAAVLEEHAAAPSPTPEAAGAPR